jgi:ubiquinone/menaquinone biosynthesis C-methylase UbiE
MHTLLKTTIKNNQPIIISLFNQKLFLSTTIVSKDQYTHGHAKPVIQSHALRTAEEYASHCIKELKHGDSILDIGCGPGSITKGFRKYVGSTGRVIGIDVEPLIIKEAQQLCGKDAEIELGDTYALRYPNESFDMVHVHQVLQHLTQPVVALKEMFRVTNRGGYISLREVDYESWFWYPILPHLLKWKTMYRTVAMNNNATPDAGRRLLHWINEANLTTHTNWEQQQQQNNLKFSASTLIYTGNRAKQWADTWSKRTTQTKLTDQAISMKLATKSEIDEMGKAWLDWSQHPDAFHFYVDIGVIIRKE